MHNTKGLEFDRVIISGMEEGLFPSGREESADELEEERRILYVSITRAKNELYLTSCRSRRIWGRTQYFGPSVFLHELPDEHIEVVDGTSVRASASYGGAAYGAVELGGTDDDGPSDYKPGTGIYHDDYGVGVIVKSGSSGGQIFIIVKFESGRSGRFIPAYDAHLEILNNEQWD
jgi:DNA helicase-2/ATP-dependent DNA helicase PcrA